MNYKGIIKSFDKTKNKDCFGNTGDKTTDHVWPTSKNGSKSIKNKQSLTKKSNNEKSDKNSGKVNGIRFAVEVEQIVKESKKKIGVMFIKKDGDWYKIEKIN